MLLELWGIVFAFLKPGCGCVCGDEHFRLVCWEWRRYRVSHRSIRFCYSCERDGFDKILSGVNLLGVENICVVNNKLMNDEMLGGLRGMVNLRKLDLLRCGKRSGVTCGGLIKNVAYCLRVLYLSNLGCVVELSRFVELEELALHNCDGVTNEVLGIFGSVMVGLRKLSIYKCGGVGAGGVVGGGKNWFDALEVFAAPNCVGVDDEFVKLVVSRMVGLRDLNLSGCRITDDCVGGIVDLKRLKVLCLINCVGFTDRGLERFVLGREWVKLELEGYGFERMILNGTGVTDEGVRVLSKMSAGVRVLKMMGCRGVTDDLVLNLRELSLSDVDVGVVCVSLEKLVLERCRVLGGFRFGKMVCLEKLKLEDCKGLVDGNFEGMGDLVGLRVFGVKNCGFDGILDFLPVGILDLSVHGGSNLNWGCIRKMMGLQRLILNRCDMCKNIFDYLVGLSRLEHLDLSLNEIEKFEGAGWRGISMGNLRSLRLIYCVNINDELLSGLSKLVALESLSLIKDRNTDTDTKEYVRERLRSLKYLCWLSV